MGKNRNSIPERWEDYSGISKQIPGTRFVAFKVPLKEALLKNLDASVAIFNVNLLMEYCPNLGLVVDLTNTDRYYDSTEIEQQNVSHYKLKTMGHVVPDNHIYFKFFQTVEEFLSNSKNNGKLIGVHCTHGVNRTGYLIIRYMIQQLKMKPKEAITAFNFARGHPVERENYLMDLQKATWPIPPKLISNTVQANTHSNFPRISRYGQGPSTSYGSGNALFSEKYNTFRRPAYLSNLNYLNNPSGSQFGRQQYRNSDYDNFHASKRGPYPKDKCHVRNKVPKTSNNLHPYDRKDRSDEYKSLNCTHYNHSYKSSSFMPPFESHADQGGHSFSCLANSYHGNAGSMDRHQQIQSRNLSSTYHEGSSNHYYQRNKANLPQPSSENIVHSQRTFPKFNSPICERPFEPSWRGKSSN